MTTRIWNLNSICEPSVDGVYEARMSKKEDRISGDIVTLLEYKNGQWIVTVPMLINEYFVYAWRER